MLSKFNVFDVLMHSMSCPSKAFKGDDACGLLRFFCKSLCAIDEFGISDESRNVHESNVLPPWVKFRENQSRSTFYPGEDFVFPSIANWVNSLYIQYPGKVTRSTSSDADKISEILKDRFPSVDAIAEALNACRVKASDNLVGQLLERYGNDWVSAFGIFKWAKSQPGFVHSPDFYNEMIDILGKKKEFKLMWRLVDEMHRITQHVSLDTMHKIMRRLCSACRWTDAVELFRRIELYSISKDVTLLNMLMDCLVKGRGVDHAHNLFVEFKNQVPPNISTFNILIRGWCLVGRVDMAQRIMEKMKKSGCYPDGISYNSFIESYCRSKDFSKVYSFIDEMKRNGCPPTAVTYTIVVQALQRVRDLDRCLVLYEKMKREGCKPDAPFYGSLIFILGKMGRVSVAQNVYEDMKSRGLSPDVTTYNALISIACIHFREEAALKLLREMDEVSCRPELKTYAPLLKMCCRRKRMKMLYFLLGHMLKNNVSIELGTYNLLVSNLCWSGKVEHACSFFKEAVSKGLVFTDSVCCLLIHELSMRNMSRAKKMIEILMVQTGKKHSSSRQFEIDLASWSGACKRRQFE